MIFNIVSCPPPKQNLHYFHRDGPARHGSGDSSQQVFPMNHLVLLSTVPSKWQNDLWCRRCAINMGTGRDYWHLAFIFDIFVFYQISSLKSHTKAELCSFPINNFFLNMLVVHSPGCSPGKSSTTQDREWLFFFNSQNPILFLKKYMSILNYIYMYIHSYKPGLTGRKFPEIYLS